MILGGDLNLTTQGPNGDGLLYRARGVLERIEAYGQVDCLKSRRERVLREYALHHNGNRPHRGLPLAVPEPSVAEAETNGAVRRRDRLGGLIHEYYREAA